ncbi:MAG: MFS transporter [Rikenellaceae bacterium]|nr:MFS transporter [Rikenellaceae bacterium]
MTAEQAKKFKYWQYRTIIATMIGYALFYFVRKNFSFAIPGLAAEYGISNTSFGLIMTVVGLIYGLSRFVNGLIADRMNGRWHMSIGLLLCVLASVAFGFAPTLLGVPLSSGASALVIAFGVLLVLNNIFQGSGFPPCARLLTHWIPPHELATKMSVWNTSHSIGASLLAILCGYIMSNMGSDMTSDQQALAAIRNNLKILNPALEANPLQLDIMVHNAAQNVGAWKWCFWIPAAIAGLGVIGLLISLRDTPKSVGLPEMEGTHTTVEDNSSSAEYRAFLRKKVFLNPVIWVLAFANFFVYVVRFAVLDWGPKFLQEARGLSLSDAGWSVATFEIFGIIGMLVAGWVTDKYFKGRAHRTCVFCMLGAAVFMGVFYLLPTTIPMWVLIIVLAMAGFFIYGPQALIGIAAANQATKSAAATANGVTGIFGYLSVFVSGLGVGAMVDWINRRNPGEGWNAVFMMMIGIAVVGMLIFLAMWKVKATGYDEQENQ